jgi:hypothetical protein
MSSKSSWRTVLNIRADAQVEPQCHYSRCPRAARGADRSPRLTAFVKWFELSKPHLAKRGDAYVVVYTISSTARRDRFWALVATNNPDGSRRCEWLKTLEPRQAYRFECPLEETAGRKYPTRVRVYSDAKLEDREVLYEPVLAVTPQMLETAANAGTVPPDSTVVPDGVVEGLESPLPTTFKPTWYRRLDRGFSLRAYENSGDLTVTADELVFVDGKKTVRLPYARLVSVRWEPMPNRFTWLFGEPRRSEGLLTRVLLGGSARGFCTRVLRPSGVGDLAGADV